MNNNKFTYDRFKTAKFGISIRYVLKLFTFLINTADKENNQRDNSFTAAVDSFLCNNVDVDDSGPDMQRILILGTQSSLKMLPSSTIWLPDGRFKTAPSLFCLFTLVSICDSCTTQKPNRMAIYSLHTLTQQDRELFENVGTYPASLSPSKSR